MTRLIRITCIALFLCFLPGKTSRAQKAEAELKARLHSKPLIIRGGWTNKVLQYDSNGALISQSPHVSFTLSGFDLKSLSLKQNALILQGDRVGMELTEKGVKRVSLSAVNRIEIAVPSDGDFGRALDAIFADGLEQLVPSLPSYWQSWAHKTYPSAYTEAQRAAYHDPVAAIKSVSGSMSPPRLLKKSTIQLQK